MPMKMHYQSLLWTKEDPSPSLFCSSKPATRVRRTSNWSRVTCVRCLFYRPPTPEELAEYERQAQAEAELDPDAIATHHRADAYWSFR